MSAKATAAIKCGDFLLRSKSDGWMYINGIKPETQKITFLKKQDDYENIELQWSLADPRTGQWYAMDFIKQMGKSMLNVELRSTDFKAPRVFGSYDCVNVK